MRERLGTFRDHPLVGEVRGKGLIAAVELIADKRARTPFPDGRAGAIAMECCKTARFADPRRGRKFHRILPPMIITRAQVDEMMEMFGRALAEATDIIRREMPGMVN